MTIGRLTLTCFLVVLTAGAQGPPQRPGSEKELDDIINKSTALGAAGDKAAAISGMESALQKVQKDPSLKGREQDVLNRLAKAYLDGKRTAESVRTYQVLLEAMKQECAPGSTGVDRCADAQYGLGTAQMYKGDFQGAANVLKLAIANYATVVKGGFVEEFRMTKLKLQGDAQALLAAALFRTGKKAEAIAAFELAIQQFGTVTRNASSPEALRGTAQASMRDAQTSLDLLRRN
jgi:tetratricopeptide (TPR) repeat protein